MWGGFGGPSLVGGAPGSSGGGTPAGTSPVPFITAAGVPTDGVTGVGVAAKGTLYLNSTNGQWYTNTGSAAAPVWSLMIQA